MPHSLYLTALNYYRNGQFTQAELEFLKVLTLHPKHADALHMLGIICYQTSRASEAVKYVAQALAINPRNLDYLNNYGLVLRADKQLEAAVQYFQQAVLLQPKDFDVQLNLGNTLLSLNRFEEAAGYYRRVLHVFPKKDDVRSALLYCLTSRGNQAQGMGEFKQAEACFQEALLFNSQDGSLYYNLGNAQRELGMPAEAAKQYQKALQFLPNDADTLNNLGNVQREMGQLNLAIDSYQRALNFNQNLYHAKVHLVHQKQHICDWENLADEIIEIRHYVNTIPEAQVSPFAFLAMPGTTAEEQKICSNNWVKNRYSDLISIGKKLNFRYQKVHNKIRIGYLSADFRLHPLAFLITELIETHDRAHFEIVGFSYGINDKSSTRDRLAKAFDQFHDIRNLSEIDAAKKIYDCDIDILVDLTGFTQSSRSGINALRPAPININWLGFPGTMGSCDSKSFFDYILADSFICPPQSINHYTEKMALLPYCYQPNDSKRPVSEPPSRESCQLPENAFVFCCFNQSFKITSDIFAIWMRLLKKLPNSIIWLLDCNIWAKQNLILEAAKYGVAKERLIFAPRIAIDNHLARHIHANLFLDTLPYNAHTTCSDALWMGLPVLTCAGNTFAGRVAGSLLKAIDLNELITYSLQDYENTAFNLAKNPETLVKIKEKLLSNKIESRLFDTATFAKSLEDVYEKIWENYLKDIKN